MLKLSRKKKWNFGLSAAYKLQKLIPLGRKAKLKLLLDLNWIFGRLAHEQIFRTKVTISYDPARDFLLSKIQKEALILDIGCGQGFVIKRLLTKTDRIVGVDYNESSVERAKKAFAGTKIEIICADIFDYFKLNSDKKFDVILLSHVLEHIDEPEKFLKNIVDKGDFFYVEVPDWEATHLNLYRKEVNSDLIYTDLDHVSEFDRESLASILNEVGLRIIDSDFRFGVIKYWLSKTRS